MPTISIFFGIVIRMNYGDHPPPHVHAEYQGREALFDIRSAEIIAGDISRPGKRMVREWIVPHRPDLMENWRLACDGLPTFRVPGLDND